jgi:hypothetical protein
VRLVWLALSLLFLFLCFPLARADGIDVQTAALKAERDAYVLEARVKIGLNTTLVDALQRGVTLTFLREFRLERSRTWWFDSEIVALRQDISLSYRPLLKRYLVETDLGSESFDTLDQALEELGRIDDWSVIGRSALGESLRYQGALRMRLDLSSLTKPIQVNAFASNKWRLESEWHEWQFKL